MAKGVTGIGMLCFKCDGPSRVKDTRSDGDRVLRVRECKECGQDMFTVEMMSLTNDIRTEWCNLRNAQQKVRRNAKKIS